MQEDSLEEEVVELNLAAAGFSGGGGSRGGKMKKAKRSYSPPSPPRALDIDVAKVRLHNYVQHYTWPWLSVQVNSGLFNATYAIPRAATIPADDTEHKVRKNNVVRDCSCLMPPSGYDCPDRLESRIPLQLHPQSLSSLLPASQGQEHLPLHHAGWTC